MRAIVNWIKDLSISALIMLALSSVLVLYGGFRVSYNSIKNQRDTQIRLEEESSFSSYNERDLSGSYILTAMRQYSLSDIVSVYVANRGQNIVATPSGFAKQVNSIDFSTGNVLPAKITASVTIDQMKDEASIYYISPQTKYRAKLVKDVNGLIVGILFIEK
jgi:hypothetical protein